jgi:hypothetical protein
VREAVPGSVPGSVPEAVHTVHNGLPVDVRWHQLLAHAVLALRDTLREAVPDSVREAVPDSVPEAVRHVH